MTEKTALRILRAAQAVAWLAGLTAATMLAAYWDIVGSLPW